MNRFFILGLLLCLLNCKGQESKKNNNHVKKYKMETFDQARFEKNKVNGIYEFILDNGTKVKEWATVPDNFTVQIQEKKSNYMLYKEFHYKTCLLKTIGETFYGFHSGIWKEYDEQGNLIKETDYDKPFRFSIEDVDKTMKKMGVDIMKQQEGVSVSRTTNPTPNYNISYPLIAGNSADLNIIVIDGITGKIINSTIKKRTK